MTPRHAGILGFLVGIVLWPVMLVSIGLNAPGKSGVYERIEGNCATGDLECFKERATKEIEKQCKEGRVECLVAIAKNFTPTLAQGALLGLIGLLVQLWWRGEWPAGQLNKDRPKVLDPMGLVTVTIAAIVAGISTVPFAHSELSAMGVVALSYLAADAATIGVDKISAAAAWIEAKMQKPAGRK